MHCFSWLNNLCGGYLIQNTLEHIRLKQARIRLLSCKSSLIRNKPLGMHQLSILCSFSLWDTQNPCELKFTTRKAKLCEPLKLLILTQWRSLSPEATWLTIHCGLSESKTLEHRMSNLSNGLDCDCSITLHIVWGRTFVLSVLKNKLEIPASEVID